MAGVYQIYNPITNKRYIGSSINVERRLKEHLRNLKAHRHCNCHLQNAYNKYGNELVFQFLEECEPDECLIFEQYYLDYYKSYLRENGYNIDPEAKYAGKHLAEETKEKLRQKALGRKQPRDAVEKTRLKNLGSKKPKQSEAMRKRFAEGNSVFPRFNEVSEEQQKLWREHLSAACKKRYSNFENRPEGYYLKAIFSNDVKYYPSLREAARSLNIDKSAITYAFKHTNGEIKKLKCVFIRISKQEFLSNKSKKS